MSTSPSLILQLPKRLTPLAQTLVLNQLTLLSLLQSQSVVLLKVAHKHVDVESIDVTVPITVRIATFLAAIGQTVEMHGNINQLVCPSCGVVVMMTPALLRKLRSKKPVPCTKCNCGAIRCRIMLYDDAEGICLSNSPLIFFFSSSSCCFVLSFFFFFFFFHQTYCCCTNTITELQGWQHDMWSRRCVLNKFGGDAARNTCQILPNNKLRWNMGCRPAQHCASTLSKEFLTDLLARNEMPDAWFHCTKCRSSPTAASL